MSQFILAGKSSTQGITQTQFNAQTDYYGTSLAFGGAPIIAYVTDTPAYATNFYFNGQVLDSVVGGTASSVVVFDTTTGAPFESVTIPQAIQEGLQVETYNYLEVSGTIPLSMNYQLNPNSASYGIGRLTCQAVNAGGATAKELTYWFSASNTANQTPTPSVGDSQYFCLVMKIGESVLKNSLAIKFILANPDVNAYALGQGSRLIVAGGGGAFATTNIQFKLF